MNDEIIKLQRNLQQQREIPQQREAELPGQGGKTAPRGSMMVKMNKLTRVCEAILLSLLPLLTDFLLLLLLPFRSNS